MPPPTKMTASQRAVHAQAKVKRESEELNEYMMDMRNWEKEVRRACHRPHDRARHHAPLPPSPPLYHHHL